MQITDFYQNIERFEYDNKYTNYYWAGNPKTLHYTTNQYGWWYPGETERGSYKVTYLAIFLGSIYSVMQLQLI